MADRPDMQMTRLSLARSAGDEEAARALFRALLDRPDLSVEQLRALSAAAPDRLDPALARKLTERRMQAGIGNGQDAMALAWTAWNAGDAATAGALVGGYLRRNPDDPAALRLMAYVARKEKGEGAARPWRERALANTPPGTREQAELLESLGRLPQALVVVDGLIDARPADRSLTAYKARLLLANGQPGRARKILQP
jgi:predicted Zn-dependent protease